MISEEEMRITRQKEEARQKIIEEMSRPSWEDPPEIGNIPLPFSMEEIFGFSGGSTT